MVLAALGLGVWKFGGNWYQGLAAVSEVAQILGEVSGGETSAEDNPGNLWFEDATVLFIRHTNHNEVAQACVAYWKEKLRQPLLIIREAQEEYGAGQYELWPEHNGWVRLFGGLDWPQPHYEGLAQHLSEKFNTLVFEARDVDFTRAYHFGVYEKGARRFHAQMDVKISSDHVEEIVTTEGDDWARAHGYKPGPGGFKEFHLGEADKIAQRLGLKTWGDEPDNQPEGLWLREARADRFP